MWTYQFQHWDVRQTVRQQFVIVTCTRYCMLVSIHQSIDRLIDRSIDSFIHWFVDWLINPLIHWFIDWSIHWFIDWFIDWLIVGNQCQELVLSWSDIIHWLDAAVQWHSCSYELRRTAWAAYLWWGWRHAWSFSCHCLLYFFYTATSAAEEMLFYCRNFASVASVSSEHMKHYAWVQLNVKVSAADCKCQDCAQWYINC